MILAYDYFRKMLHHRRLNMSTKVMNMPVVLNMPGFYIFPGFWVWLHFWICKISKYTRVLNILGLYRVLNMPEYEFCFLFFSIWVFFHVDSRFLGQQGKVEAIYLTPLYHFHPLHRRLEICRRLLQRAHLFL